MHIYSTCKLQIKNSVDVKDKHTPSRPPLFVGESSDDLVMFMCTCHVDNDISGVSGDSRAFYAPK